MQMGMDMGSASTTTSMGSMATSDSMSSMDTMTFFTSSTTSLYSVSWTPKSQGQYAGTCIFLIVLSVILRFLIALKPILERRVWTDSPQHHTSPDITIEHALPNKDYYDPTPIGVTVGREFASRWSNWKVNPAGGRACYEVVIAGIAYLLMLAVMTMNVGYFLSVLGGIWLGTFILGGLAADSIWSHTGHY